VSQAIPHVIERIPIFFVEHPIGDVVAECMGRYVVFIATTPVDLSGLDIGDFGDLMKEISHALLGMRSAFREGKSAAVSFQRDVRYELSVRVVSQQI
jgi:hypothetical protein